MKKNILKTVFLLFSFVTFAQNNLPNCNYNDSIFKLLPYEMTFDIEKYKVESMTGYDRILVDNENYKSYFRKSTDRIYYNQTNRKNKVDKSIYYYYTGKIERIVLYYQPYEESGSIEIGSSTIFNPDGTVQEIYNYDKGYKICYDEAISIVKKIVGVKKIKKYELKFSVGRVDLNQFTKSKAEWYVGVRGNDEFYKKNKKSYLITYVIDGISGKFLTKKINRIVP